MELVRKAKEHLILYHPFFAYLALQVEFARDDSVGTSSIDGINFKYNEEWLSQYDFRWVAGLIAHGMGHVLLLHPLRAEHRNIKIWNQACDYAVNSILKDANVSLVNDLFNTEFKGLDTETIYDKLLSESNKDNDEAGSESEEDDSGSFLGFNDGSDFESGDDDSDICKVALPDVTETPMSEMKATLTQKIMDAATQSQMCGESSSPELQEIINNLKEPKKDWRELLHKFTAEIARDDYDWMYPDRSYLQRDLYIPGLQNEEIGGVIFAIDTSGSVNEKLLQEFLSELKEAASLMTEDVTVIHCDTKVQAVEQVQMEDVENIKPVGRGGTRFIPVFEYIEEHDLTPKVLIYFTDGYCWEQPNEPEYPVLWCIYDNFNFEMPFGEIIRIDK